MREHKTKSEAQLSPSHGHVPFNPRREGWFLMNSWLMVSLVLGLLWPSESFATSLRQATSLGDIICNLHTNAGIFPGILGASSFCVGLFLVINGIMTLRKHVEGGQSQVVPGTAKLLAGGFFTVLPAFTKMLQVSIVGKDLAAGDLECMADSSSSITDGSTSLDVILSTFVRNIYDPMSKILAGICIVVGLLYIARGIMGAAKVGSDPQGGSPKKIIVNFVMGAVLLSAGQMLNVTLMSVFGAKTIGAVSSFSLNWSKVTDNSGDFSSVDSAVQSVLAFIQILGMIGFVRGWMVLKAAIEGGGQATVPQGLTFVIGGAMAINITKMLTILDATFGTGMVKAS